MTNFELLSQVQALATAVVRALEDNETDETIAALVEAQSLSWEIIPELEGIGLLTLRSWLERRPTSREAREHLQDLLVGLGRTEELKSIIAGASVQEVHPLSTTNLERHKKLIQETIDAQRPSSEPKPHRD